MKMLQIYIRRYALNFLNRHYLQSCSRLETSINDRFVLVNPNVCKRYKSDRRDRDDVGSASSIVQDGLNIQELPVLVRKIKDISVIYDDVNSNNTKESDIVVVNNRESDAIKEGFNRCSTAKEIFQLLEIIPANEVTPSAAAHAFHRIAELKNNVQFRNEKWPGEDDERTFTSDAVLNQLCDCICKTPDSQTLIWGLKALSKGNISELEHQRSLVTTLVKECILRISENKFNITSLCHFVETLSLFEGKSSVGPITDNLWTVFVNQVPFIDIITLSRVFNILPLLKNSRKIVFSALEHRTFALWWQLKYTDVVIILQALQGINFSPQRLLCSLTNWVNMNIHTVPEDSLAIIVDMLIGLKYSDSNIEKALDRFLKIKAQSIKEPHLVISVSEFCFKFRLRSKSILDGVATYFIFHGSELSPYQVYIVVKTLGMLNYIPSNDFMFFTKLEEILAAKFVRFRPQDVIELMLSCIYIQRFPLNFVRNIFNPFFLDRMHDIQEESKLRHTQINLKLIDTSLTLECSHYRGPILPKDYSVKSFNRDGRIERLLGVLSDSLTEVMGGREKFTCRVTVPGLPFCELYCIDILVQLGKSMQPLPFHFQSGITKKLAVLIHLPEHYCSSSSGAATSKNKVLIGPQAMRARHLMHFGYTLVNLDYAELMGAEKIEFLRSKILNHENKT